MIKVLVSLLLLINFIHANETSVVEKEEKKRKEEKVVTELQSNLVPSAHTQKKSGTASSDDIETDIERSKYLRYELLQSNITPQFIKDYILFNNELRKKYNFEYTVDYRVVAQANLDDTKLGSGGKYSGTLIYRPQESTALALRVEGRHQIGSTNSTEFYKEQRLMSKTSLSYRKDDPFVSYLLLQQKLSDFVVRLGKMDPSKWLDTNYYKSDKDFFFNSAFAADPYNSYPQDGFAFAGKYETKYFYAKVLVSDAGADRYEMDNAFIRDKDYYSGAELGLLTSDDGKYYFNLWHRDKSDMKESAEGFILSGAHTFKERFNLMLKLASSDNAKAKRFASLTLGMDELIKENDTLGFGLATLIPSNSEHRTQSVFETFYRIDPIPGAQLSCDLQVIYHPTASYDKTWVIIPGLRARMIF